jgi:indole-3-acetate monooxygenase
MLSRFPAEPEAKRAALLAAVDDIRDVVLRHAGEAEKLGTLPRPIVDALIGSGLLTLKLPAALGGAEADPVTQFDVIEKLSAIDPSTGWCLMIGGTSIGVPGAFLPDAAIARVFAGGRIPTAAFVSMPTGTAVAVDGGYRVTGQWSFLSGVPHAEWVTVGARVVRGSEGPPEMRLFIVPIADAEVHDNWDVAGLRGTGSCDVSLDDCFVAEAFTWTRTTTPVRRGGALYRLGHPGFVANEHAAFALGCGRGALDAVIALAKSKRRSFAASPSALESRSVFQRAVGLGDLRLRSARALVLEIYREAWQHACAGDIPPPRLQAEMRSVTVFATEVAAEVTTEAFRYAGGEAVYGPQRLQRFLRDINVGAQHLMVSDIAYEHHGQFALGFTDVDPLR